MNTQQIMPDATDDKTIFAENHSLFIEEKPSMMVPVKDENGNQIETLFEQTPSYTVNKLFLGAFDENGNGMHRIANRLQESSPNSTLEMHISSRGGYVHELIELYNLVNTVFHKNVVTYCNYGYSAGALAFLMGSDRVVYEHSDWMMHSYSGGFGGKRDDMITHLEHEDARLQKFFNQMMKPYFTKKELKKMQKGKDFWMGAEEMLKRGIATHIIIDGESMTAQDYLDKLYPKRKKKRLKREAKSSKTPKTSKNSKK